MQNEIFPNLIIEYEVRPVKDIAAKEYHEQDKEGLRKLLSQPSAEEAKLNWELAGLTSEDIKDWETSEEWIDKLYNFLEWNESTPKRILGIYLPSYNHISGRYERMSGKFEGSYFPELDYLIISSHNFTSLDMSSNMNLSLLNANDNGLNSLELSNNIKLEQLDISRNELSDLDLTQNINLTELYCYENKLTDLDLSKNINLTELYCYENKLTALDLSENINLTKLYAFENELLDLYISKNINLTELYCYENKLTALDLSKNINLSYLDISNNKLTALDVTHAKDLARLIVDSNELISFKYSNSPSFWELYIENNRLLFSNLLLPSLIGNQDTYRYNPQKLINGGKIRAMKNIDLSSEYLINHKETKFEWFKDNQPIQMANPDNGIFMAYEKYIGSILICKMQNENFPELTLEYQIEVVSSDEEIYPVLEDHLKLITSEANKTSIYKGDEFTVYAKVDQPEFVKIGLFTLEGEFVQDITQSVAEDLYTSKIDEKISVGDYILIPYILDVQGNVAIIERTRRSNTIVDRILVTVLEKETPDNPDDPNTPDDPDDSSDQRNPAEGKSLIGFPNPASDYLYLNIVNQEVEYAEIYNLNGTLIRKVNQLEKYNNSYRLAIHDLSSGMYIVKLKTPKKVLSYKMIKK